MDKKKDKNQICISSEFLWIFLVIIFILIIFGLYMFNIFPFNVSDESVPNVSNESTLDIPELPPASTTTPNPGAMNYLGGVRIFKKK